VVSDEKKEMEDDQSLPTEKAKKGKGNLLQIEDSVG